MLALTHVILGSIGNTAAIISAYANKHMSECLRLLVPGMSADCLSSWLKTMY